ncbi:MAG: hypothetical protein V4541_06260 [Bacteroidota bacterium]
MRKILFCCFILPLLVQAQQVQWASKVLKYSSDLGGKLNSIKRILGKPDAFPQGGPSANAWVAKDAQGTAYVEVEFEQAQTVKQIAVFENLNAGCVSRIMVGNAAGKFRTVSKKTGGFTRWINSLQKQGNPDRAYYFNKKRRKIEVAPNVENNADIEYFFLEQPEQDVKMVRVEFNFALKPGQKQVDAIAISDLENPIQPPLNLIRDAEKLSDPVTFIKAPNQDYALNSLFILGNDFYYTISVEDSAGEVHVLNLIQPTAIKDVTKHIKNDDKLNFILGYVPETKTVLMGSENKYRQGSDILGFDFFSLNDGDFTYQKPLKITAYNNYGDYADAFLTRDGKHLIFGIESDLTQGGYDLYFTQPKDENTFSLLQNMSKGLNSAADETNPFMLSDDKTLLFASNGYSGYGDFDLYVSTRLDDTWKNWSKPKNLGPKVNGQSFDTNPYYDEQTEMLYYVSFRDGLSTIQKIKIPIAQLTGTAQ